MYIFFIYLCIYIYTYVLGCACGQVVHYGTYDNTYIIRIAIQIRSLHLQNILRLDSIITFTVIDLAFVSLPYKSN